MQAQAGKERKKQERARGPGSGRGSSLGSLTKFAVHSEIIEDFSSYKNRVKLRWRLAWAQREAIFKAGMTDEFKSLVKCHAVPVPRFSKKKDGTYSKTGSPGCIEAHYYGQSDERPVGYAWLNKDGNALICFLCAPKIHYYRVQEVQTACLSMMKQGYGWVFLTFTAPHDLTTDPRQQVKRFNKAMRIFKAGNSFFGHKWEYFKQKYGFEHQISARELTDDSPTSVKKSGCHWHTHALVFFRKDIFFSNPTAVRKVRHEMAARWVACLEKVGLCSPEKKKAALRHAFRLDVPRKPKTPIEDAERAALYVAKGASCEISPGIFTKTGRLPARISHWEVMALAFSGRYPRLVPRALAIMRALKGKDWLRWTAGLKKLCGIEDITDQEIMKEKKSLPVYQFSGESWRKVDSQKWQMNLLNGVLRDLKKQGFDFSQAPEDLDDLAIRTIATVFAENLKKVSLGVDPEKVEFYSHRIISHVGSVREYIADLVARNLRQYGRQSGPFPLRL